MSVPDFTPDNVQAAEYIAKLADAVERSMPDEKLCLRVPNEEFAVAMAAVMRSRGFKATHSSGLLFNRATGKMSNKSACIVYVSPKRKARGGKDGSRG